MRPNQSSQTIPFELSAAAGIALVLSNQWLIALIAGVCWFILRSLRPATSFPVLLVTSIQLGTAVLVCISVATGMFPSRILVEVAAITLVALLLYFTGMPVSAYLLIVHSGYVIFRRASDLHSVDFQQRSIIGTIALQAWIIWMLILYLRQPKHTLSEVPADTHAREGA